MQCSRAALQLRALIQKSPASPQTSSISLQASPGVHEDKELWDNDCSCKRALHHRKRALYHNGVTAKEPCIIMVCSSPQKTLHHCRRALVRILTRYAGTTSAKEPYTAKERSPTPQTRAPYRKRALHHRKRALCYHRRSPHLHKRAQYICKRVLYLLCLSMYIDGVWWRDVQRCDDECALHVNASSYYYRGEFYIRQRVRSPWNLLIQRYIFTYTYIYIYMWYVWMHVVLMISCLYTVYVRESLYTSSLLTCVRINVYPQKTPISPQKSPIMHLGEEWWRVCKYVCMSNVLCVCLPIWSKKCPIWKIDEVNKSPISPQKRPIMNLVAQSDTTFSKSVHICRDSWFRISEISGL